MRKDPKSFSVAGKESSFEASFFTALILLSAPNPLRRARPVAVCWISSGRARLYAYLLEDQERHDRDARHLVSFFVNRIWTGLVL
jgi:hypothetical protein